MYTKDDNLVDADAYGSKASTKHLESRLEVIHSRSRILGPLKSPRWTAYCCLIMQSALHQHLKVLECCLMWLNMLQQPKHNF